MRLPFSAGVISDATKIKNSGSCEDLFELLRQDGSPAGLTDFSSNYTKTDSGTNVNIVSGEAVLNGSNAYLQNGLVYAAIPRASGYLEFKFKIEGAVVNNSWQIGISSGTALPNSAAPAGFLIDVFATVHDYTASTQIMSRGLTIAADTYYTYRIYLDTLLASKYKITIQGGTFTEETTIADITNGLHNVGTNFYFFISRYANSSTRKIYIKEVKWFRLYPTDAPYVDFVSDAGASKLHYGVDFTNLALPTNVPTNVAPNNLEFAYSYDDGTPSFSGKYTLTNFKAIGAISGNKRYLRIRVYANSNGETQTYIAPINADDAVASIEGAGAVAPEAFLASAVSWGVQSVKVSWGASAGAMTYRVFRDTVDVSGELRNVSQWIDSPVPAGTYEYVVKAYNAVAPSGTASNTVTLVKGTGGLATIYDVLMAIYRAMFNMQKIEKVGSTYYLNTYDDDDTTLVASCALKTFDAADIGNLAGTVTPSIRLKSAISGVGAELTGTIWERVQSVFKKEFNTRKNEEVVVGSGVVSEVLYDDNDTTKISQQALKTFNGDNLPSQLNTTTPSQRMRSSI